MSYDLLFLRKLPAQDWSTVIEDNETNGTADTALPPDAVATWSRLETRVREILGDIEVAWPSGGVEASHQESGITVSFFGDEAAVSIPYWYSDESAAAVIRIAYRIAEAIEQETGLSGYDTQLELATVDAEPAFDEAVLCFDSVVRPLRELNVFLSVDGAILVREGDGAEMWVTILQLREIVESARADGREIVLHYDTLAEPTPATRKAIEGIGPHTVMLGSAESVDHLPDGGNYVLVFAAGDHIDLLDDLLERGADPNSCDVHGNTPLMLAARTGHRRNVQALLRHGAMVDATDHEGNTALMFAAQGGHARIVKHLLDASADPNARGEHGYTAFAVADQNGHQATANLLRAAGGR